MWLFAMFDLPVDTKEARRAYTVFRKALLGEGFVMLQFSVYARYNASEESTAAIKRRLRDRIPVAGQVRFVAITDHQFGKMDVYVGKRKEKPENAPEQMLLF